MFFAISAGVLILILVLTLVISFPLTRDWFGQRVARRQTFLLVYLFGSFALLSLVLYLVVPNAWHSPLWLAFQFGFALFSSITIIVSIIRPRRAGSVILDLGPITGHHFLLLGGGLYILMVLGNVFFDMILDHDFSVQTWAEVLFRLSLGSLFLFQGTRHIQLRERGILHQQFIPWHKIRAYGWEHDHPTTLTLRVQSWSPFATERNLSIPIQHRNTVNEFLAQHVTSATTERPTSVT